MWHTTFDSMAYTRSIWFSISILLQAVACASSSFVTRNEMTAFALNLLHESMNWMDTYYDSDSGYLYSLDAAALTHETRASAWYAAGLFARNEGDDAEQAAKIIRNVIDGQHKNVSSQWFGKCIIIMS